MYLSWYCGLSLQTIRQVLITRRDGCILLFDDCILEHKLPDDSRYDNRLIGSQLPVRSVFKTPEKLPVLCAHVVGVAEESKRVLWCGTKYEMLLVFDVYPSRIDYCRKHYCRSRYNTVAENRIVSLAAMDSENQGLMWALSLPANVLYCWDREKEALLRTVEYSTLTHNVQGTLTHDLQGTLTHNLLGTLTHNLQGTLTHDLLGTWRGPTKCLVLPSLLPFLTHTHSYHTLCNGQSAPACHF